jgi:RNA polymerase sigma-70 factor (ECF subfamily)
MYSDYADDIYRFLYVHVHDKMLAEDLTADTFTKAWQKLDKFDFRHPRGWLYTIARNTLSDHWRTNHTGVLIEDFDVEDERDSTEIQLDRKIAKDKLLRHLAKLPEDMRSVVTLRFLQGYSARHTGQALGISEANVRVIQHRALKILRKLYQ